MSEQSQTIAPDTKDWTWVIGAPCPECGSVAAELTVAQIPGVVRDTAGVFAAALRMPGAAVRPRRDRWSVLEYACHVRDVNRIFADRVRLMLAESEPLFPNWDQDATAQTDRYDLQDPEVVARELLAAADAAAARYASVPAEAWGRRGLRGNGSEFTVESIARYHLHDLVHHCWDITPR